MRQRMGYQPGYWRGYASRVSSLNKRELEILWMMSEGHDKEEIALVLGIRSEIVKDHTGNLLSKMQAKNRAHAAMRVLGKGWGEEILSAIKMI